MKKKLKSILLTVSILLISLFGFSCDTTTPTGDSVKLQTPTNIRVDITSGSSIAYFTGVENCKNYMLYIYLGDATTFFKKQIVSLEDGVKGIAIELANSGTYKVSIQSLSSSGGFLNSDISSKVTFEYKATEGTNPITYYDGTAGLEGKALLTKLRVIISSVLHTESYDELKTDLAYTDQDPTNEANLILFYSHASVSSTWRGGDVWNREHLWPQSTGWFKTSGAGSDIHHLRPEDPVVNSTRGNNIYSVVSSGKQIYYGNQLIGKLGNNTFEPNDNVKGDIARIVFYMMTRYSQSDSYKITAVASSYEMLLQWNESDPVDSLEITRNERAYSIQGNRNPFIDYPNFASSIWG